jgi:hypothetical protein
MDFMTGSYGQDWTQGVLAEHLPAGVELKVVASGKLLALRPIEGRKMLEAVPVLCGEIVEIYTEDGRMDGRCGLPVHGIDGFACPGHQASILAYRYPSR